MSETPEQIWIQPQYVNGLIEGGGIYHLKGPSSAIIQVVRYIREDLATCTPEERVVIDAAIADREALKDVSGGDATKGIDRAIAARNVLLRAVNELIIAKKKSRGHE